MRSICATGRRRTFLHVLCAACVVLATELTPAGQTQDGSIMGQVTDESGAVLPGVTVTASSPALQVRQVTSVTDGRGEYRLTPLPLGTYTVEYVLPGFQTLRREDLRLTAAFVARVDVSLTLGALTESVVVSGAAPVVDVTTTATRTQLTRETLEIIPTGRNSIVAVMAQAPGARPQLNVNALTGNPVFRVFGQNGGSWTMIEGVGTTSPKSGTQGGNHFDYASFEETTVQTVGNTAESPTRGIQINAIVKSGGNDFHGGAYWGQTNDRLQSSNIDDALRARRVSVGNPIDLRRDVSADLGGRIVRDKLWFYYAARRRDENERVLGAFKPDASQAIDIQRQIFSTTKVSYQIGPSHKLIGFYQWDQQGGITGTTQFVPWESRQKSFTAINTSKLEWQWVRGNTFLSVQQGAWIWNVPRDCYSDQPATFDQLTNAVSGCNTNFGINSFEDRFHTKASLTWYKSDLLAGNHDFKVGFESNRGHGDRRISDRGEVGNYRLIFRNGVPFQMDAWNNCFAADVKVFDEGRRTLIEKTGSSDCEPLTLYRNYGAYVQDSWTIARRLTLNLGVRYDRNIGSIPEQCRSASAAPLEITYPAECFGRVEFRTWNPVTPRLHAAYDVTGDGMTVIKGGWGRFAQLRYVDQLTPANENVHLRTTYLWRDLNGNKLFNPGEINFDRNGPDFVSTSLFIAGEEALAGAVPNPNEKQPMDDELSISIERQLMTDFAVRATGIYSRTINAQRVQNNLRPFEAYTIPVTNLDPGPDGRPGTADDPGTSVTYWEYPASLAGRTFQQPMLVSDSRADQTYKSFEVAASKRLSNRWQMMASYSATKLDIPITQNTQGCCDFQNPGISLFLSTRDPQRGNQHGRQQLGVAGQGHWGLYLSGRRAGVGKLRAPQRHAVCANSVVPGRPDDSGPATASGAHRHPSAAEHQPAALPGGEGVSADIGPAGVVAPERVQPDEHQHCHEFTLESVAENPWKRWT
ncbi:MAG: TonB-dependent receptor [Acidobacteria bacterium]|nr:TonB-dependent receptor [Acidobacteriota bacterium]